MRGHGGERKTRAGRSSQRGQILVLFAAALVAVLAAGSLVVDLGFSFMVRRQAQNAADPGAIAAARFIRTGPGGTAEPAKMVRAACFYAQQNGFFTAAAGNLDGCVPANDENGATLTVNYPPSTGAGEFAGSYGKVEVIISRSHRTFLAGILGITSINVSSSAVGAYDVGESNLSSLIALDSGSTCMAGKVHGGGTVNIHPVNPGDVGGYLHVNSTCGNGVYNSICGSSPVGALAITGGGSITVPHAYVKGTCSASGTLVGDLTEGAVQIGDPLAELPPPAVTSPNPGAECGIGSGIYTTPTGSGANGCRFNTPSVTLDPGIYYGGWAIQNNVTVTLNPGVYIIAGGGIRLNAGGSITSVAASGGAAAPVLIFNTDNPVTHAGQASIDFVAQATLKLHGLDSGPYKGILIWNDGQGSNPTATISLGGQSSVDLSGTIYSPKGLVTLEGGSGAGSTAAVQIISWQWDIGGGATLDMPYDPSQIYQFPNMGLVK